MWDSVAKKDGDIFSSQGGEKWADRRNVLNVDELFWDELEGIWKMKEHEELGIILCSCFCLNILV